MKYFFKFKIFLLSLILLSVLCLFGSEKQVKAGAGDNVDGWAWNSNIGWISFNSNDCDTNENSAYDAGDTGPAGCPAVGTPFFDYGVNIDIGTGNFSGYAWSGNVGWISFNRCGTDGNCATTDGDTGDPLPLADDPGGGSGPIAKFVSGDILGWAKILSMGDDGWIRFDHGQAGFEATGDVAVNELNGFAWNANLDGAGIGWISFNCEDYSSCLTGSDKGKICTVNANCVNNDCGDTCLISNYQTRAELNQMPIADNLTAPNWTPAQACGTALVAYLKWDYNDGDDPAPGDKMSAYRLVIKNKTDGVEVLDTGKCIKLFDGDNSCCDTGDTDCLDNPADCQIDILGIVFGTGDTISYELDSGIITYGKAYSWEVEVWDSKNGGSGLIFYDSITDTPLDVLVEDNDDLTFTTFVSEFPNPDAFIWTPNTFSAGEEVLFESMNRAKYYVEDVEHDCDESNCSWDWFDLDFNIDPTPIIDASSTIVIFEKYDIASKVKLKVTDNNTSYSCASTTDDFWAKQKLPSWIEVK